MAAILVYPEAYNTTSSLNDKHRLVFPLGWNQTPMRSFRYSRLGRPVQLGPPWVVHFNQVGVVSLKCML